jgi:hypothetical protein
MARGDWDKVIDIGGGGGARMPPFGRGVSLPPLGALRGDRDRGAGLLLLFTTYYQIEPDQLGVVQRFGAFVRTSDPGPHLKLPFGIETVTKVPVQRPAQDGVRLPHHALGRAQHLRVRHRRHARRVRSC